MICRSCWKVVTNGKCACWPESPSPGKQGIPQQPVQAEVAHVDAPDPDEEAAMRAMTRVSIEALKGLNPVAETRPQDRNSPEPTADEEALVNAMARAVIKVVEEYWRMADLEWKSMEPAPKVEPAPPDPTMADQVRGMVAKNLSDVVKTRRESAPEQSLAEIREKVRAGIGKPYTFDSVVRHLKANGHLEPNKC